MNFFRKIRQALIREGNLKRYILYAIGEILLVMIGISLAFQVDNWNDNRINKNTEIRYYENILNEVADDEQLILGEIHFNTNFLAQFRYANEILETNDRNKIDTLGRIIRNLPQYSDFDMQGNIYETLVNSGEIKLLQNQEIVSHIRSLEEKYQYINRMENIHYDAVMLHVVRMITPLIRFSNGHVEQPELVYSYEVQNVILLLLQVMNEKDQVYHEALDEIETIIRLINAELQS